MLILDSPLKVKALKLPRIVCAIGIFDGVHLGHKEILASAVSKAKNIRGTSAVITFDNHPDNILNKSNKIPLLTVSRHKLDLLGTLGLDVCVLMEFNKKAASISADKWIKQILWNTMHINSIFTGEDFCFGNNRKGNIDLLHRMGTGFGFNVYVADTFTISGVKPSSSLIRHHIIKGELDIAETYLGRQYSIYGTKIKGKGIGRKLGFPTLNFNPVNQCMPPCGVYAAWLRTREEPVQIMPAAVNMGNRPTINKSGKNVKCSASLLEAHILDYKTFFPKANEFPAKDFEIMFVKRLRNEIKFNSVRELTKQIKMDVKLAEQILSN